MVSKWGGSKSGQKRVKTGSGRVGISGRAISPETSSQKSHSGGGSKPGQNRVGPGHFLMIWTPVEKPMFEIVEAHSFVRWRVCWIHE